MAITSFPVTLISARPLSPSVRELVFRRSDREPMRFVAGQWFNLDIPQPDGPTVRRAYSIASPPSVDGTFELAVTRVIGGPGSEALHALAPGSEITASGPSGFFTEQGAEDAPAIFVGTGTGVTPLRSMIMARLARTSPRPVAVLWGFRHEEDLLYPELCRHIEAHGGLAWTTFSQPRAAGSRSGYVQLHAAQLFEAFGQPDAHVYICGLQRMVSAVRDLFRKDLGLDRKRVHSERFD